MSRKRVCTWAKRHPKQNAAKTFKQRRGITYEQRDAMLAGQGGVCKLCGGIPAKQRNGKSGWHVDHRKGTKTIRGILCQKCNLALGLFGDNSQALLRASIYVHTDGAI